MNLEYEPSSDPKAGAGAVQGTTEMVLETFSNSVLVYRTGSGGEREGEAPVACYQASAEVTHSLSLSHTHTHSLSLTHTLSLSHTNTLTISLTHKHTFSLTHTHCLSRLCPNPET